MTPWLQAALNHTFSFILKGKVSAAIGSTSLTITEKSSESESPPQHYRQRESRNDNEHSKPLFMQNPSKPYPYNNGTNKNKTDGYSKEQLSSVQGYGTLPRRSKKSSSSSANSSCITAIQAKV